MSTPKLNMPGRSSSQKYKDPGSAQRKDINPKQMSSRCCHFRADLRSSRVLIGINVVQALTERMMFQYALFKESKHD